MKIRQHRKQPALTGPLSRLETKLTNVLRFKYAPAILGGLYLAIAGFISFRYHRILDFGVESDFLYEYVPIARKIAEGSLPIGEYRGPV